MNDAIQDHVALIHAAQNTPEAERVSIVAIACALPVFENLFEQLLTTLKNIDSHLKVIGDKMPTPVSPVKAKPQAKPKAKAKEKK